MRLSTLLKLLADDRTGISSLMFGVSATALIGAAAFAVDMGSLYLARAKLQGLADAAAMSIDESDFASGGQDTVNSLIVKDGSQGVQVVRLIPGTYTANSAVAPENRFQPVNDPNNANAMEVRLEQDVPLFFGAILTGNRTGRINARAIATRTNLAAYSIGTRLTNLGGQIPNQILSSFGGVALNLSASDMTTLANNRIDILAVGDALKARFNLQGQTYSQIFARDYQLADLLQAYASASTDNASATILAAAAAKVGNQSVPLAALIDLGKMGQSDFHDTTNPLRIDALTLLRAGLELSQGEYFRADIAVSAAGLASASLTVVGKNATVHSPMMTVTDARDVVLRTAATRVYLDTQVLSSGLPAGIASLHVPFYAELAPGEARMTSIVCKGTASDGVTLGVKPGIGSTSIGTVNPALLDDFSAPLTVSPAQLANTLAVKITGSSTLTLSGNSEQSVLFTLPEISAHTVKSVYSSDIVASLAASLVNQAQINVSVLGLGLNVSSITQTVGTTLGTVAPTIDSILDSALKTAGVGLGVSDVSVDRVRCGVPVLVG